MAVRIFNPDTSEAQKSGNGLRIAAAHAVLEHGAGDDFELRTDSRANPVHVLERNGAAVTTQLDIGRASFRAADLPARFKGEPDRVHIATPAGRVGHPGAVGQGAQGLPSERGPRGFQLGLKNARTVSARRTGSTTRTTPGAVLIIPAARNPFIARLTTSREEPMEAARSA